MRIYTANARLSIDGSFKTLSEVQNNGVVGGLIISSGAVIDLTENANTSVFYGLNGGNVTFGANVTIINSAGSSGLLNGGTAGSCTVIKNDGTTA